MYFIFYFLSFTKKGKPHTKKKNLNNGTKQYPLEWHQQFFFSKLTKCFFSSLFLSSHFWLSSFSFWVPLLLFFFFLFCFSSCTFGSISTHFLFSLFFLFSQLVDFLFCSSLFELACCCCRIIRGGWNTFTWSDSCHLNDFFFIDKYRVRNIIL